MIYFTIQYFSSIFSLAQEEVQSADGYSLPFALTLIAVKDARNREKRKGRRIDGNQLSFSFRYEFNLNLFYAQHATRIDLFRSVADDDDDDEHIIYLLFFWIRYYTLPRYHTINATYHIASQASIKIKLNRLCVTFFSPLHFFIHFVAHFESLQLKWLCVCKHCHRRFHNSINGRKKS